MKRSCIKPSALSLLIIPGLLLAAIRVQAQDTLPRKTKLYGSFGHVSISAEQFNIGALNEILSASGYPGFNTLQRTLGGGGAFCIGNVIIGGGGGGLRGERIQHPGGEIRMKGSYGYFSAGYVLHSGSRSVFFPSLQLGGGDYRLNISQSSRSHDFSDQLNSPAGTTTIRTGGWFAGIQLSYQYFFRTFSFIGAKAGYRYSPGAWTSSVNKQTLSSSPGINMNGFYLSLVFGGGYRVSYQKTNPK